MLLYSNAVSEYFLKTTNKIYTWFLLQRDTFFFFYYYGQGKIEKKSKTIQWKLPEYLNQYF